MDLVSGTFGPYWQSLCRFDGGGGDGSERRSGRELYRYATASLVETHYLSGVRRYRTLKSDLVEIRQGGFDIILIRTYPVEWE